jgi:AcrR family transcriptional regulator
LAYKVVHMKRKTHQGKIYDKEKTKQKLIKAVGSILVKEGFQNIKVNRIEAVSGVSKKLIYRYFGGLEGLIQDYLEQRDFWNIQIKQMEGSSYDTTTPLEKEEICSILEDDFRFFEKSPEMQKIILWGISEKNKTLKAIANNRERFGKPVFKKADLTFKDTDIDFRAVSGTIVAAIYYLILHGKMLGTTVCEIDITKKEGKERYLNTFKKIIELCYAEVEK